MKLNYTDLDYINTRMDRYDIKYQEIYDEIKDHIITAIEFCREKGDDRKIAVVFDEQVEKHFPGYLAFQDISKEYEKAYRLKIRKMLWGNMKYYANRQVIGLIVILTLIGFYLPKDKIMGELMIVLSTVIAIVVYFYALWQTRKIKLNEGKKSIVKNQVTTKALFLLIIVNTILNCLGFIGRDYHINYLNPRYFHPVVHVLYLSFFVIYGLSSGLLCRQELKLDENRSVFQ